MNTVRHTSVTFLVQITLSSVIQLYEIRRKVQHLVSKAICKNVEALAFLVSGLEDLVKNDGIMNTEKSG